MLSISWLNLISPLNFLENAEAFLLGQIDVERGSTDAAKLTFLGYSNALCRGHNLSRLLPLLDCSMSTSLLPDGSFSPWSLLNRPPNVPVALLFKMGIGLAEKESSPSSLYMPASSKTDLLRGIHRVNLTQGRVVTGIGFQLCKMFNVPGA